MAYTHRDFNEELFALLRNEGFLAHCAAQINRQSTETIPTAAIGFDREKKKFTMWYNPKFMESLSVKHRRGVILHELFHFINHHITTRMPDRKYMKIWNYATDLAINDHISDMLPEFCLVPGRGPFADLEKFPHNKTADFYFEILKEEQDKVEEAIKEMMEQAESMGGDGDGGGNSFFDNHDEWLTDPSDETGTSGGSEGGESGSSPGAGAINEIAKQKARQILQKAVNEASKTNSWGSISASMRQKILDSLKPQVNWKSVLRSFVQSSQKSDKKNSVMKINRRKPYVRPGKRQKYVANILVAVDMSGSVEDGLLAKFFAEIDGLAKYATFTVAPFDTEVLTESMYVHEKGKKCEKTRVACGGTSFQCVTDYANEHKEFDALIILTDLGASRPGPCRVRRIWLADQGNASNPCFDPASLNERLLVVK